MTLYEPTLIHPRRLLEEPFVLHNYYNINSHFDNGIHLDYTLPFTKTVLVR